MPPLGQTHSTSRMSARWLTRRARLDSLSSIVDGHPTRKLVSCCLFRPCGSSSLLRANAANASAVRLDFPCGQRSLRAARSCNWPGDQDWEDGLAVTTGSIGGTVTDSSSSAAIANAAVSCGGGSTTTAGDGTYTFATVAPGTHTVAAAAGSYVSQSHSATVSAGMPSTQDFALTPVTPPRSTAPAGGPTTSRPSSTSSTTTQSNLHRWWRHCASAPCSAAPGGTGRHDRRKGGTHHRR
jgi:Carboxypeptidase regulatory-like domain